MNQRVYAEWTLEQLQIDPNFRQKNIYSDEAHSGWMGTSTNKIVKFGTIPIHMRSQSVQWITKKSQFGVDFRLAASSVHISLRMTLARPREFYRSMITNFFGPELDDMGTNDMWFQQDGVTCHTAHATLDIVQERFEAWRWCELATEIVRFHPVTLSCGVS